MQIGIRVLGEHRSRLSVRTMCRCLRIHPSGYYDWMNKQMRKQALEEACQNQAIHKARQERGKVYGYPMVGRRAKPQDDRRCVAGLADGRVAQEAEEQGSVPLRHGLPIYQHGLGSRPERPLSGTFNKPLRQLP